MRVKLIAIIAALFVNAASVASSQDIPPDQLYEQNIIEEYREQGWPFSVYGRPAVLSEGLKPFEPGYAAEQAFERARECLEGKDVELKEDITPDDLRWYSFDNMILFDPASPRVVIAIRGLYIPQTEVPGSKGYILVRRFPYLEGERWKTLVHESVHAICVDGCQHGSKDFDISRMARVCESYGIKETI